MKMVKKVSASGELCPLPPPGNLPQPPSPSPSIKLALSMLAIVHPLANPGSATELKGFHAVWLDLRVGAKAAKAEPQNV